MEEDYKIIIQESKSAKEGMESLMKNPKFLKGLIDTINNTGYNEDDYIKAMFLHEFAKCLNNKYRYGRKNNRHGRLQ